MATSTTTEIIANETEIAKAMNVLGLGNLVENLLDEIELDRELEISIAQADRGETFPIEELEQQVMTKLANGYYDR